MIILWIRKKKKSELDVPAKNRKESFKQHNEVMKQFRLAHPDAKIINARDIMTADGNVLAPVDKVKMAEHIQN